MKQVITTNGGEMLIARTIGASENMALVYWLLNQQGIRVEQHVIILNPREYWELHDYIEQHGAPRPTEYPNSCTPGCPSAPMQAGAQDGDPTNRDNPCGEAGDLDRQPATNMNWEEVGKCNIWRELGVSECDGCPGNSKCWTASPPNNKEVKMESKSKQNPDYSVSAVNLCNPERVQELLALRQLQEWELAQLREKADACVPLLLRDNIAATINSLADTNTLLHAAIDELGSYQDIDQGIYAVKQIRRTVSYLAEKVRAVIPQFAEAVIDGVNKSKVAGLLKGGLVTQEQIDQFSSTKEDYAYIVKYPPTGKEESK